MNSIKREEEEECVNYLSSGTTATHCRAQEDIHQQHD